MFVMRSGRRITLAPSMPPSIPASRDEPIRERGPVLLSTTATRLRSSAVAAIAISALTTAVVATSATPAHAAEGEVWLDSSFGASAIAIGSAGKSVPVWYRATATGDAALPPTVRAIITTPANQAVQVHLGEPSPGCWEASFGITCERTPDDHVDVAGDLRLQLTPAPGAAVGDHAQVTIEVSAPRVPTSLRTYDVTVTGSGADLQVSSALKTVAPGGMAMTRPTIRNTGDRTAKTVLFAMSNGSYSTFPVHYRNCRYRTDDYGYERAVCLLEDVRLAPGESLTPSSRTPLALRVKTNVPGQLRINRMDAAGKPYQTFLSYDVASLDTQPTDERLSWPLGNGPELKWNRSTASATTSSRSAVADLSDDWGQLLVTVSPNNPSDLSSSGVTLSGRVGDLITVPVGIRNYGPAAISATPEAKGGDASDPYNAGLRFTPPPNTEVVDVTLPPGHLYQDWYEETTTAGKTYLVLPFSLPETEDYQAKFTLRITKAGTGTGKVVGQGGVADPNPANNISPVTVRGS
ncbi:hypothetical protein ACWKSP_29060 [Micromonosporaceae bacterium Da 78-11]